MPSTPSAISNWAAIYGTWIFDGARSIYTKPDSHIPIRLGIALGAARLRRGSLGTSIDLSGNPQANEARVVFGYNPLSHNYYAAGLGGYGRAYVIDEYLDGRGWQALTFAGSKESLDETKPHDVIIQIRGQQVSLQVDGITVLQHQLARPLPGDQVGLLAVGPGDVVFRDTIVSASNPQVFVVMQYGEPYDSIYSEVIAPACEDMGLSAFRADDIHRPGIILQDIITGIVESEIIIAEITPPNPNVFYELGYSHALSKSTILLAERGRELPFDVRGYRCIFYSNTISGKRDVDTDLRKHLESILNR